MPEESKNDITILAETNFRNQRRKFGIRQDDRRRHLYLIGKTGMGKSTVIENMAISDIQAGRGVAVVDPHGDLAEKIIDFIPGHRINDVIYFNPADLKYPIAFNVMEAVNPEHKHLVASGLIGVFKKLWADTWGPRLEYLLRNAILALMDYPSSTLLGIMRILVDKNYRKKVIAKIKDPVVRSFWVDEYSKYSGTFQVEAINPIQNKVGQFLSTALIRNIVGQVKSRIDLREIMDNKKILIMNLSKGRIGEDASALLGAMMITKIQLAAMSRIEIPEEERQDFYLYVDEFQNFATESFANILSEARKYRLNLIIAHQYIEQLDEAVRAAVFGNVGTIMCFRIGAADAEFLVQEFAPYFTEEDLVNLTKYDVYMKLMIDGVSSSPFSATTLPPLTGETGNRGKIIKVSQERYGTPQEMVEDKIARWSGMEVGEEDKEKKESDRKPKAVVQRDTDQKAKTRAKKEVHYVVDCYECGQPTEITFKPDGIRPVYCKRCFQKIRERLLKGEDTSEDMGREEEKTDEVSLKEALEQRPVSFSATKNKDRQSNPEPKNKKGLKEKENSGSPIKELRPGQVIKF